MPARERLYRQKNRAERRTTNRKRAAINRPFCINFARLPEKAEILHYNIRRIISGKERVKILIASYVIPLDPRTKKNSPQIAGTGKKCPYCGKLARQFIVPSKANKLYSAQAALHLTDKPESPIDRPVHIKYLFYKGTRHRVDALNLAEAADDILVEAGILADDNSNIVKHHDGTRVLYDKQNPRTEIYIYEYEEEEDV